MSQTEEANTSPQPTAAQVERVRKVFVRDLSLQQKVHTVFRVAKKSRHVARSGKAFLALSLVDKTGEIPGRIFDNVETADIAFEEKDYLLLKGTVIHFRGKPQLVIEQLERLAPEPMEVGEFTPPEPPPAAAEKPAPKNKQPKAPKTGKTTQAPAASNIAQALEMLGLAIEAFIQEKMNQHLAHLPATMPPNNKPSAPVKTESSALKTESSSLKTTESSSLKTEPSSQKTEPAPEPKTDTSPGRGLPKEFAFKPFELLTAEENTSLAPSENASSAPSETQEDKLSN